MIRFTLKCDRDHIFESWFQSGDACDRLIRAGMVACTHCGSSQVSKSMMAPAVSKTAPPPAPAKATAEIKALREKVEATSDYVGKGFASEARAMHDGVKPERAIYGEASLQDARNLIQDGIPIAPLPFMPKKKLN